MNQRKQELVVSPRFLTAASTLSKDLKAALIKTLMLLAQDVRHPGLQCKKVQGRSGSVYECRVDQKVRLIYDISDGKIRCWYVGIHDAALRFATNHPISDEEVLVDDIMVDEIPSDIKAVLEFLSSGKSEDVFHPVELEALLVLLQQ